MQHPQPLDPLADATLAQIDTETRHHIELICHFIAEANLDPGNVARKAGMSLRRFIAILDKPGSETVTELRNLQRAVGIDPFKALLAIERCGDWQHYFHERLVEAADLFKRVQLHGVSTMQ